MSEIIFIMGKSASGKDKIFKELLQDEELQLQPVIMYTTRPMRAGEEEGREYHFVDETQARKMLDAGQVVEMRTYQTVEGPWRYFTADDGQIRLQSGKRYLVIGTLEAYAQYVKHFGAEHLMPVYVESEDKLRLERSIHREEKQETPHYQEICRRFLADEADFSEENLQKAGICERFANNGELEDCILQIRNAILKNV